MDKKHFFVQPIGKHLPGVLMAVALLASSSGFGQAVHGGESVIERFLAPDAPAKPMARMWFPDASAGEDDNDLSRNRSLNLRQRALAAWKWQ